MDAGVIQGQRAFAAPFVVLNGRFQLFQNLGEVITACFHRYRFPVIAGIRRKIFLLDDFCEGVEIAFLLKGFLDQFLRVRVRRQGVGLDELLAAVEILSVGTSKAAALMAMVSANSRHRKSFFIPFWTSFSTKIPCPP